MEEILKLMQEIVLRPPGEKTKVILDKYRKSRQMALGCLTYEDRMCAWCNKLPLPSMRHKYCDKHCMSSAYLYCYPQSPDARLYRLIHLQQCACTICGESFEEKILEIAQKKRASLNKLFEQYPDINWANPNKDRLTYHMIGNNTGDTWQTDHIIPLHLGGDGLGFDNTQTVCSSCHMQKTIQERSN